MRDCRTVLKAAVDQLNDNKYIRYVKIKYKEELHRVPKKEDTKLMAVTLSFLNLFSKFFH